MLLKLTRLAAIALLGGSPGALARTAPAVVTDSGAVSLLTSDQVTSLITVAKALRAYWKVLAHAPLLETAETTAHKPAFSYEQDTFAISVYDYPALVRQDSALAAVFSTNHLPPEQFEPIQVAVYQALFALCMSRMTKNPLPTSATVLGKNAVIVEAQRKDLGAVGIFVKYGGNQIIGLP